MVDAADGHHVVTGGKTIYGIPLGILMLDTVFPRIPGDVGHAATWPFPVLYRVVRDAEASAVVRNLSAEQHLPAFLEAALELERAGVALITTSCGFLARFQGELQQRLQIPIVTSSLLQVPWLLSLLPEDRDVGVLTIEARSLTAGHLEGAGVRDRTRVAIQGLDEAGGYFTEQILGNRPQLDVERAAREHEMAAKQLLARRPRVGCIVLECTNMPPYAARIRAATRLPVYDLTTLITWVVGGIGGNTPKLRP